MTPVELAAYVRLKTRTNSTTFSDDDLLTLANVVKNDVCQRALEVDEDIFTLPATYDLVANQREYPLPSDILSRIKKVELKFSSSDDYVTAYSRDMLDMDFPISSETLITAQFTNEQGHVYYDLMRKSLWIYSGTIAAVTDGIKLWVNTYPANIASILHTVDMSIDPSTTAHGVPRELHRIIATGVIIEYKQGKEKPIPLNEKEQKWEFDLEKAIQTLKKADYSREIIAAVPVTDGSEY